MSLNCRKFAFVLLFSVFHAIGFAQGDFMRQTGKIYVVYAVLTVIFLGLFGFVWRLDNRISKIEKQFEDEQQ